ncbi:GNAT family N-acetyltransferase [Kitasatospora sp. NPDC101235]|uniref:GNAT family N-acetyltransferase n=1 Tax=Kitasatospora sp. NPDC101235 TaxID=3364101 RepID=UPI0037FE1673
MTATESRCVPVPAAPEPTCCPPSEGGPRCHRPPSTRPRPGDAEELLRLRVDVLTGQPATDAWRTTFLADMQARLGTGPQLIAFVADGGDGVLAACAIGVVYRGYDGLSYPGGLWGRVYTVVTDPRHRRQGLAEAVPRALVNALQEQGCSSVELSAHPQRSHRRTPIPPRPSAGALAFHRRPRDHISARM